MGRGPAAISGDVVEDFDKVPAPRTAVRVAVEDVGPGNRYSVAKEIRTLAIHTEVFFHRGSLRSTNREAKRPPCALRAFCQLSMDATNKGSVSGLRVSAAK